MLQAHTYNKLKQHYVQLYYQVQGQNQRKPQQPLYDPALALEIFKQ